MSEHREVVVIGAGQAGLALGYFLAKQARDFQILDGTSEPAGAWRSRWDSLSLFTPARFDSLPGLPFPGDPDHYPGRDEVVDYLTGYAERFELPVRLNSRVSSVRATDGGYTVGTGTQTIVAGQVVVATGPFQTPRLPVDLAECLDPGVQQLHSADYMRPSQIVGQKVLVVGGGNTGYQIAEELAGAGREVHLAIGTKQPTMPQRLLGRDTFVFLDRLGAMTKTPDTRIGRRMKGSETLVGYGPRKARRQGIHLRERAVASDGPSVSFSDGAQVEPDAVIWATGFSQDHRFVDVPAVFTGAGDLIHQRGVTPSPGLYFLGLPWLHTRGSALLGWVKNDAAHLAEQIAQQATGSAPAPSTVTASGMA